MKHLFLLLCMTVWAVGVFAQNPRQILDKAAETLTASAGVEINFQTKIANGSQLSSPTPGTIALKGAKFRLEADGIVTWFDGKTQWTYVKANEEVNISEPTQEELEQLNPYAFIHLYKKGYSSKMGQTTQLNGKPVYEVDLLAEKQRQQIWQVVLIVHQQTYQPLQIKVRPKNGQWFILNISQLKQKSLQDSYFTFQPKDAPGAEMIDLR